MGTPTPPPRRKGFALTGPSVRLDPATHAVRADLADVRLAEFVFAPHYAAPVEHRLTSAAPLRQARAAASAVVVTLAEGDSFEVLDLVAGQAWGVAPDCGCVGWIDGSALDVAA
ncbi:MAG TPA: SH3 domain-containing protein [Sphingomonas sp.]|jgi:hypothetical protein